MMWNDYADISIDPSVLMLCYKQKGKLYQDLK